MRHLHSSVSSSGESTLPKDERHRLALTLHDSTAQSLAALTINLDLVGKRAARLDPRARRILAESRSLASQCFEEVLALVGTLYPPLVDQLSPPRPPDGPPGGAPGRP
jgi:signal transduction histidine kinase